MKKMASILLMISIVTFLNPLPDNSQLTGAPAEANSNPLSHNAENVNEKANMAADSNTSSSSGKILGLETEDQRGIPQKMQLMTYEELWYLEELDDIYYYAGVKVFFKDLTQDILSSRSVTWTSDNPAVAEVLENGSIIPRSEGTARITAEYKGLKDTVEVTTKKGEVTKFYIDEPKVNLKKILYQEGNQNNYNVSAVIETSYGQKYDASYYKNTLWTISDEAASIDCGYIGGLKKVGDFTITANFKGLTAASDLSISDAKIVKVYLKEDGPLTLQEKYSTPRLELLADFSDGTTESITPIADWQSENPEVASVSGYDGGETYAEGIGETVITVKYGDFIGRIPVIVIKQEESVTEPNPDEAGRTSIR